MRISLLENRREPVVSALQGFRATGTPTQPPAQLTLGISSSQRPPGRKPPSALPDSLLMPANCRITACASAKRKISERRLQTADSGRNRRPAIRSLKSRILQPRWLFIQTAAMAMLLACASAAAPQFTCTAAIRPSSSEGALAILPRIRRPLRRARLRSCRQRGGAVRGASRPAQRVRDLHRRAGRAPQPRFVRQPAHAVPRRDAGRPRIAPLDCAVAEPPVHRHARRRIVRRLRQLVHPAEPAGKPS